MMLMAAVLTLGVTSSCSDAEEGEDWDTWTSRNMLNGKWSLDKVKVDGQYILYGDVLHFEFKFVAEGRKFELTRTFEGDKVNKSGIFTIDQKNNVVEGTDSDGNKVFRMKLNDKITSSIDATITFYDINKTYDVYLNRSI